MMPWTLVAMLSTVKDLWQAVDQKSRPFCFHRWEGHVLSFVQQQCFQFEPIRSPPRSCFKRLTMTGLSEKFNDLARPLKECNEDDPCNYFEFGFRYMRNLFQPNDHETISILPSVEDALGQSSIFYEKKNVIIVVGSELPDRFGNNVTGPEADRIVSPNDMYTYECQSIILLRSIDIPNHPRAFDAVSYMRHGGVFKSWWQ